MSGFEVPEARHVRLVFSDPSYAGLEVVCRLVPVGQLSEAASLADIDPKAIRPEDARKVENLIAAFAAALVSWNLTRKGRKVPATRKGIDTLDLVFTMQLIEAWLSAVGEVLTQQATGGNAFQTAADAEIARTLQAQPLE